MVKASYIKFYLNTQLWTYRNFCVYFHKSDELIIYTYVCVCVYIIYQHLHSGRI